MSYSFASLRLLRITRAVTQPSAEELLPEVTIALAVAIDSGLAPQLRSHLSIVGSRILARQKSKEGYCLTTLLAAARNVANESEL